MHIAGGLYREACLVPAWNAEYGSGGRAAATVIGVSPATVLHTYAPSDADTGVSSIREKGVEVRVTASSGKIAFAYFHPLSTPCIAPPRDTIRRERPLKVSADAVLRFSLLEGDAVVTANRAVYDPQMSGTAERFAANGSTAQSLALVLNEFELRAMAGVEDLSLAAGRVREEQGVAVVVVKCGARGAIVFDRGGDPLQVPVYRSSRVFKIGTGDVFSAMFTHFWAEIGHAPARAADLASRAVANYSENQLLPVSSVAGSECVSIAVWPPGPITLHGRLDTLGRRYVVEEARFALSQLGATTLCPELDPPLAEDAQRYGGASLLFVDSINDELSDVVALMQADGVPVVILSEESLGSRVPSFKNDNCVATDDFTTALYWAIWAAIPDQRSIVQPTEKDVRSLRA